MRVRASLSLWLLAPAVLASCPYAKRDGGDGHAHLDRRDYTLATSAAPAAGKAGVFFMNRIGPSSSELFVANADGTGATSLLGNATGFEYHASWSADGKYIYFTGERRGDGQADIYRTLADGSGTVESVVSSNYFEDAAVLSPDGTKLAYISTMNNYVPNLWIKDLAANTTVNVTNTATTVGSANSPDGHFRPSWSPDSQWVVFSSDRNTDWTGHNNGTGWEHTQELSIYAIKPDGSGFRKVVSKAGYSLGWPKFSPDGKRVIFYSILTSDTFNAHRPEDVTTTTSQIVSVDFATGTEWVNHTTDASLKMGGAYIGNSTNIGYLYRTGTSVGWINYTSTPTKNFYGNIRNPAWSPDGTKIVYESTGWGIRAAEKSLWSFDSSYEYRFMDVFPMLNNKTGRIVTTQKQFGNSSIVTSTPGYTNLSLVFDPFSVNDTAAFAGLNVQGLSGAFQPTWTQDASKIAFGVGAWFFDRVNNPGALYIANADGSNVHNLTDNTLNAGFPSFNPNGTKLVYRLWNLDKGPLGLRIMDLATGAVTKLTDGWDNTPGWSPDGERIVFTRNTNWTTADGARWKADRFDVCTIRPDGTDLQVLTTSGANDAHAVWTNDGRIAYSTGMYGFRDECALFDDTFQPYGQIVVMNYDGSNKVLMTDTLWEDSMPLFVPAQFWPAASTTKTLNSNASKSSYALAALAVLSLLSL